MKIALRADASPTQGTGHVLRTLTLASELKKQGHEAVLFASIKEVSWVANKVLNSGISYIPCKADFLDLRDFISDSFDTLVVDSYQIASDEISTASTHIPTLAIIDHDQRGIVANWYLDHNIGAELKKSISNEKQLNGPTYALIRSEIFDLRRTSSDLLNSIGKPKVLVMIGGTDPLNVALDIANSLQIFDQILDLMFVTNEANISKIKDLLPANSNNIFSHTPDLGLLLSKADMVISAAGTSVLDLSCIGIPTIFLSVAHNQDFALTNIANEQIGLAFGHGSAISKNPNEFRASVERCLNDDSLRERYFENGQKLVDGLGAVRVVNFLEEKLTP